MIEQRTIIDHKLYHVLIHPEATLEHRVEEIHNPVEIDGLYIAQIPNVNFAFPIIVEKDTEIKVVYFSRKSNE